MHWDDLRVVRAVFRTGSYAAAARELGVNETTVPRRLARLEKDLGVVLFNAVDGQRRPSPSCERIVALSESIALQAEKISSMAQAPDAPVERRRIAATDSVSTYVLAPNVASFLAGNPGIAIEIAASTANVDFSRWEADIAIRLKRPEKGDFVVSKLMDMDLFLVEPADLAPGERIVCVYPSDLDATPESRFLQSSGLASGARFVCKNLLVNKRVVESGTCAAVLPGYMCADIAADERFRLEKLPQTRSAWLLIQQHLRSDPATRTVVDWLRRCAEAATAAIE